MPSDADQNLEWIDITDFTPGIVNSMSPSATLPIVGAADGAANTMVNCVPGASGIGLVGGPKRIGIATKGGTTDGFPYLPNPDIGFPYYTVMDAMVSPNPVHQWLDEGLTYATGSLQYPSAAEASSDTRVIPIEEEIVWGTQVYSLDSDPSSGATSTRKQEFRVQHLSGVTFSNSLSTTGGGSQVATNTAALPSGTNFAYENRHHGFMSVTAAPTSPKGGFGWVCLMHNTAQIQPAMYAPTLSSGSGTAVPASRSRLFVHRGSIDGLQIPTTTLGSQSGWVDWHSAMNYDGTSYGINDEQDGYGDPLLLFQHQGRLVSVDAGHNTVRTPSGGGTLGFVGDSPAKGTWTPYGFRTKSDVSRIQTQGAQALRFSAPLGQMGTGPSVSTRWGGYLGILEPLGGIVSAASLDSSTLFVLGNNGAARITGDLGTGPQVTFMPTIPGAKGYGTQVIRTPVGIVFGTASGAWLWSGGAIPELLSPNLPPKFWVQDEYTGRYLWQQPKGRPAVSWPFLFFPNGWMCYLPTRTWSRLDTRDGVLQNILGHSPSFGEYGALHYSQAPNGDVVGVTGRMPVNGTTQNFLARYDTSSESAYWSWKSQPILRSRYRILSGRELNIAFSCNGSGNLYVDIRPEDGTGFTKTIAVSASTAAQQVRTIRLEISVDSPSYTIQLAWAGSTDANVMHVHRVSLGYRPAQSVQRY